jgi:hypothetical protein
MRDIRTSSLLFWLGMALIAAGNLAGSAAAGWKMRFSPTPLHLALAGSGGILFVVSVYLVRAEGKRREQRAKDFQNDLKAIADDLTMSDPEDRLEDLLVLYDEDERKDILNRLERMPKGRRTLRVALDQVEAGSA